MAGITLHDIFQRVVTWPTLVKDDIPRPPATSEQIPSACDGQIWDYKSLIKCITAVCKGMGQQGAIRKETKVLLESTAVPLTEVAKQFAFEGIRNLETLAQHGKTFRWLQWHASRFAIENIPGLCGGPRPQPVMDASPVPVESEAWVRSKVQEGCTRDKPLFPLLAGATLAFGLRLVQKLAAPSTAILEWMLPTDFHDRKERIPEYL